MRLRVREGERMGGSYDQVLRRGFKPTAAGDVLVVSDKHGLALLECFANILEQLPEELPEAVVVARPAEPEDEEVEAPPVRRRPGRPRKIKPEAPPEHTKGN